MKTVLGFLRSTLVGGLLVLMPLMLFGMLVAELFDLAVALATPIADLLPGGVFSDPRFPTLLAVGLLVFVAFVAGLALRLGMVRAWGGWIEQKVLLPLPGYRAIKSLVGGLFGTSSSDGFKPVIYHAGNEVRHIAYHVEDTGDGHAVILMPYAPTPMAGCLYIVPASAIEPLPASLVEVTAVLSYWGKGAAALLRRTNATAVAANQS